MCLLAIQYQMFPGTPILAVVNRDEAYDRPTTMPSIQSGKPRVLCPLDQQAGGTWCGVNQNGLFVAASNRYKLVTPPSPRSRGLLCKDLLRTHSAREAVDVAMDELTSGIYDGVNFVIADSESGWVVHGGDELEVVELSHGLSIIANRDVNDLYDERVQLAHRLLTLQTLDSPVKFLAVVSKVFSKPSSAPGRPSIVVRGKRRGTVSSILTALGTRPRDAIFQYAAGPPDETRFEDSSPMLRDILSRGLREIRAKAEA